MLKKVLSIVIVLFMLVGCGSNSDIKESNNSNKKFNVAVISSSSGFGDGNFNDQALIGMEKAKKELGINYDKVQVKEVGAVETSLTELSELKEYDLIICLTYEAIDALNKVSKLYPEQKYALVDSKVEQNNVVSYMTKDEEGSFLAGVLAALIKKDASKYNLSSDNKIGFIGGKDAPNIRIFEAGYVSGAKYINQEIEIMDDFVGSFTDPTTTKEIANNMIANNADVIYHVAGMSGNGLFEAVKEKNKIAIGVNFNQNSIYPDNIAGSMVKRIDVEVFTAIKTVLNGNFTGKPILLGVKEEGVDVTQDGSNIELSDESMNILNKVKENISQGKISIPKTMDEVKSFNAVYGR